MPVQMSDHLIRWRCRGDGARFALRPAGRAALLAAIALLALVLLAATGIPGQAPVQPHGLGEEAR